MSGLFRDPAWLWGLLAAVAGTAVLLRVSEARRRRLLELFAKPETLDRIHDPVAAGLRLRVFGLEAAALCFLLLALAGPQWGVELVETQTPGAQVALGVDVSLSMLAEDVPGDRLQNAQRALSTLIDGLKGARVGIVAFSGEAHVQCPLTSDVEAAKSLLRRLRAGMIPQPGTELAKAIERCSAMLARGSGSRTIVLLTDGEDLGRGAEEAAEKAARSGLRVYILGVGSPEGGPIPLRDASGRLTGYKKDPAGKTVVSRLDETLLLKLAAAGGGEYARLSSSEREVSQLIEHIEQGGSGGVRSGATTRFRDRYRLPLALAVLLLAAALLLPPPSPQSRTRRIARAAGFLVLALFAACSPREDARVWKGNSAYKKQRYAEALQSYARALPSAQKKAPSPKPLFNAGDALYRMGEHERAAEAFAKIAESGRVSSRVASAAAHNLGNALFERKKYAEAAEAYRRCLLLDPKAEDCRHNLALSLKPPQSGGKNEQKQQDESGGGDDKKNSSPRQQSGSKQQEQQGAMTREDAERILQAVKDRERAAEAAQQAAQAKPEEKDAARGGRDW